MSILIMDTKLMELVAVVSLKARLLRQWQLASSGGSERFGERESLCLEMIKDFPDVTEKTICRVFDVPYSSAAHLVKKLTTQGLLYKPKRGERLRLTQKGTEQLREVRGISAARIRYLLVDLDANLIEVAVGILERINESASKKILECVFDRPSLVNKPKQEPKAL